MRRSLVRLLLGSTISVLFVLSLPATSVAIDEFPLLSPCPAAPVPPGGTCQPAGITAGSDGAIWFTEENGNRIGRMTTGGTITHEISLPNSGSNPSEITPGPGGHWFTQSSGQRLGRVNPDFTISQFTVPGGGSPDGIVAGPDGNIWFTKNTGNAIGRYNVASNTWDEFPLQNANGPGDIVLGPDGRLWFTASDPTNPTTSTNHKIGAISINAAPGSNPSEYTIPTAGSEPSGITATAGALWFTEFHTNRIGRISTTGVVTNEFPAGSGEPSGIAAGSDGALYYTETGPGRIGRMTTAGSVTNEFLLATPNSQPGGITNGPDGALWFAEHVGNKIGRIAPAPPFVPPPPPPAPPAAAKKKKCKVPKLRNLTVKKARKKLKRAKCKYRIRGKGRFSSSRPKAGRTTSGTVVVKFKKKRVRR